MSGDEIFGYGWREDHARAGDAALTRAEKLADQVMDVSMPAHQGMAALGSVQALAAIAQAHYAAAKLP